MKLKTMGENFGISRDTACGEILHLQLLASFIRLLFMIKRILTLVNYFVTSVFCFLFFFL